MESRVKLFGHPIHPMLIVLPLGLFISAGILDAVYLGTGNSALGAVGFWNIGVGILGGLLAAVFGLIDWLAIPRDRKSTRLNSSHLVISYAVFCLKKKKRKRTAWQHEGKQQHHGRAG